jgi:hypothetical protein
MLSHSLARVFRPRLRTALASLLMVFVLATAAHFAHLHEPASDHAPAAHHVCGFCASFSGAADAPRDIAIATGVATVSALISLATPAPPNRFLRTAARPRAPPLS